MISDAKVIKAVDTVRRYCDERGCNSDLHKCVFHCDISGECMLKVKAPCCFPAPSEVCGSTVKARTSTEK